MIDINECQLRAAFKNPSTKDFPYFGIYKEFTHEDHYGIAHYKTVEVYGKRVKTVLISQRDGYRRIAHIIGKYPPNSTGYADAASDIEKYFAD